MFSVGSAYPVELCNIYIALSVLFIIQCDVFVMPSSPERGSKWGCHIRPVPPCNTNQNRLSYTLNSNVSIVKKREEKGDGKFKWSKECASLLCVMVNKPFLLCYFPKFVASGYNL